MSAASAGRPGSALAAPALRVDVTSPVPPYEQLREQIAGLIATGLLRPGQRLPPVRQVAADLGLAGGTVARAYRELAQAGLVEGGGRHGTLVRSGARTLDDDQSGQRALSVAADHLASIARDRGLSDDVVLAVVRNALARTAPQRA
jgi:GntR family transcriptional regulator